MPNKNKEEYKAYQRAYKQAHRKELTAKERARRFARREELAAERHAKYMAHREEVLAQQRAHRAAHREEISARRRAHRKAHRAELAAKWQARYAANPRLREANRARVAAYQEAHREEVVAKARDWRIAHRDEVRARKVKHRARKVGASGAYTAAEWRAMRDWFGGVCLACGTTEDLSIDHVIPFSAGGTNDITNLQLLCRPCNSKKGKQTTDYRDPVRLAAFLSTLVGNEALTLDGGKR